MISLNPHTIRRNSTFFAFASFVELQSENEKKGEKNEKSEPEIP
jgi:hypothetical protein